jgi:tight adherence protein B
MPGFVIFGAYIPGVSEQLVVLFGLIVLLLMLAAISWVSVNRALARHKKLQDRIIGAISTVSRPANTTEEQISLAKTVSRSDEIKARAAGIIGVDLQQAETYPIKWWLVPPIGLFIAWIIIELAVHPLGHPGILFTIVLPVVWLFTTKFIFNWFNNRRNAALLEQFPDALATIVRCVRVGIPMAEALRTVARDAQEPTKAEFTILADKVSIGIPLDIALRELSIRIKLTEYQFFATAITLQSRSGGGITQTLETLAEVIRKRVGLKQRGYALTAEARTSAMILAVLPFLAGGAIFVMQRPYITLLFDTHSGQSCLGLAILLMGTGLGTIQFMISNVLK